MSSDRPITSRKEMLQEYDLIPQIMIFNDAFDFLLI